MYLGLPFFVFGVLSLERRLKGMNGLCAWNRNFKTGEAAASVFLGYFYFRHVCMVFKRECQNLSYSKPDSNVIDNEQAPSVSGSSSCQMAPFKISLTLF